MLANAGFAQTPVPTPADEPSSLPLPQHPDRVAPNSDFSRPKAAQPNRESHAPSPTAASSIRRGGKPPMPGRPARGLLPPGEQEGDATEEAGDESAEEAVAPGLLRFLPHELYDGGLTIEYIYTGETFNKARGGLNRNHPTNYRSNLDLVATLDTELMNMWSGGRFFVYGQNLVGQPLSPSDVGDIQLFSNLDSTISATDRPQFTTIAEYWYQHNFMGNLLRTKVGKQDANADFAFSDLGGEFVHSSFGVPPNIPLPTFPSQALGMAAFAQMTDTFALGFGIYDGTPASGPQGVRWGFDTLGQNGAVSLYQAEWKPQFGAAADLPHTSRFGMFHHSANDLWVELTPTDPRTFVQNYGLWYIADQMLWKEGGADDDQGLGAFFQFCWAPSNRNIIGDYYGGGLVYKGLLSGRDEDYVGVGFANAVLSQGLKQIANANGDFQGRQETAIEVFYKYRFSPYFTVQPDLQFISQPGGIYDDALLPGLRFELVL
jgi:porin